MDSFLIRLKCNLLADRESGMEMVQVALIIGIAIAIGLVFKSKIGSFVNEIFGSLNAKEFTTLN